MKVQQSIPEMFALAISFVVYVCSFEGKVFKRGESDDEEEYELLKKLCGPMNHLQTLGKAD